jgi:glycosyltransferase involved in cell wall biosynthesis
MSASTKGKTVGVMARDRGVPVDVSVVLPTRNRSALLASALRSVVIQQGVRLEIIVVDEASTDDTAAVLGAIGDPRVRVIRHECSLGVSAARNRGAAEGRGDWLAFLDDDDLWAPDKLARQLHTAHATGRDWAYTGAVNITEDGRIAYGNPPLSPDEVVAALRRYNAIPGGGSNVVVRRKTWRQAGPFDSRLRNTEDWEMWIRLARQGVPACVSSPLVGYRVHGANSSLDVAEIVRGAKLIEALHHTSVDWGRLHRWMAESCLRRGQRRVAYGELFRAAVRGQAHGVTSDLYDMVRRRVARFTGGEPSILSSDDAWIAEAARWLKMLDTGSAGANDHVPSAMAPGRETEHGR